MKAEIYWFVAIGMLAILFIWNLINLAFLSFIPLLIILYGFAYKKSWAKFIYFPYFIILLFISLSIISLGLSMPEKTTNEKLAQELGIDVEQIQGTAFSFDDVLKEYYLFTGISSLAINSIMLLIGWKAKNNLTN